MGNMSASDAAPLPRLGEVYFDVRGESRSMRLSWYADTGVAVFSIWQGGTCTGTFRLPIADLPRMIDALQRGPQGDAADPAGPPDAPRGATEPHDRPAQRGRTGPHERPGHGPEDYGPGADSGPGTGYADPGLPATGAHREADSGEYGRTGAHGRYEPEATAAYSGDSVPGGQGGYRGERADSYADEPTGVYRGDLPGEDYREDPGAGYRDGGQRPDRRGSGHQGDPRGGGHQDDPLSGGYREDPLSGRYREDPLGGHPGDRRTSGYREDPPGGGYQDDTRSGDYQGDPRSGDYQEDSRSGGYREDPLGGYREDSPSGGYRADSPSGGYREDAPSGGFREDSRSGGYRDGPGGGYQEDPLSGDYQEDPRSGGYQEDPRSGGYRADSPSGGYREDSRGGRRADRHGGGDYADDPLTGAYPEDQGTGGYSGGAMTDRYRADPGTGDYPTGPRDPAIDSGDYAAPAGNTGYSPARPYVAPLPGGPGGAAEGRRRQRRRPAGREESDPSPDSFPYGRPAEEPEVRGRGR